jgi:ABC-type antimicrobial peptide transport system permease subunit
MKKTPSPQPPRWARQLLQWYCRPDLLEDLEGDLNEYFQRNCETKGIRRARWIFVLDVLKFFRLYTIRKPQPVYYLTSPFMIGSYLKTSGRNIVRNKLFSAINIVGLAISMSVGLLVIAFLSDLLSYDDFHEKKDRIYRVITTDTGPGSHTELATTSVKAGKQIQETVPGVEALTLIGRGFGGDARVEKRTLPMQGLWADASFFKVFTFPLLQGNPATALKEPYSLVLTEQTARKLFGEANVLGKSVQFDTTTYVVTGVMQNIPKPSHLRFDALVSFATAELQKPNTGGDFLSWESIYMNYVYLVLPENGNSQALQANLDQVCARENARLTKRNISLSLQPLKTIVLGKDLGNQAGPTLNRMTVWVLGGLAFVVIMSACFNYTNLSIARSLRRTREVSMRKILGALKQQVLAQFTLESVLIALLSLVFSLLLFLIIRREFLALNPFLSSLVSLELSPHLLSYFVALAVIVGIVAGLLPALFFSRIQAIQALKSNSSLRLFQHVNLRKALIVVQYTFSLIFITATMIGYKQYQGFLTLDLGFNTDNIINIRLQGNSSDLLKTAFAELPEVKEISHSRLVTSIGNFYGAQAKYQNLQDSSQAWLNFVDEAYLPLHQHQFLAGTNFRTQSKQGKESEVIVNEQVLKKFNIGQQVPAQALGETLLVDGQKFTIVGVLKDFHYGPVDHPIEPTLFRYSAHEPEGYLNVKISSQDWPGTLASLEKAWKKIDQVHPLEAQFYDDQIEEAYAQYSVMLKVIGFLALLAVCIASMGLFGMVVYTTETRLKEISIRKVLGADERNLIYLMSKGLLFLLALSALIALPVTYLFFNFLLTMFVYHAPIEWMEMLTGAAAVIALAFLMIGSQTLKVARTNPAQVLKNE